MATFKSDVVVLSHEELQCTVCHELKLVNYSPRCMHIVCTTCYDMLLTRSPRPPACPVCRISSNWFSCTLVDRIVGAIKATCEYCANEVAFRSYDAHTLACPSRVTRCARDQCSWQGSQPDKEAHDIICPWRMQQCGYCGNSFYQGAYADHTAACNYRRAECKICGDEVMAWQLKSHECIEERYPIEPPQDVVLDMEWRHLAQHLREPDLTEAEQRGTRLMLDRLRTVHIENSQPEENSHIEDAESILDQLE